MTTLLIVDDETDIRRTLRTALEADGYAVREASDAGEARRAIEKALPDLILLDVKMPGEDGLTFCRRLREEPGRKGLPIIFLTSRGQETSRIVGLEMGADDYIVKPYDNDELVARVNAHLRRVPSNTVAEEVIFDGGDFRVNFLNREVIVRGESVHLTPKEFDLLSVLVRNAGRVVTRHELVTEAWGPEYADDVQVLRVHIANLRRKIERGKGEAPRFIRTDPGVGYRFAV